MVIIANRAGRLSNRLWLFANFIGNSCAYGYSLANTAFYEYAEHFENLKENLMCRYPQQSGWPCNSYVRWLLFALIYAQLRIFSKAGVKSSLFHSHIDIRHYRGAERAFDLCGVEWEYALRKRIVFVEGLEFRDWASLINYRREILDFLAPRSVYINAANALTAKARAVSECNLCGIHMRFGDYKQYKSGQWFYSIEQYVAKMREFEKLFRSLKPVRFLVCSDKNIPQDAFQGLPVTFSSGHFMEDQMALSQCDFIFGPPSTFAAWASFCGDVPLCFLFDLKPLTREFFIPITERLRRHMDLATQHGEKFPHIGFLELCK